MILIIINESECVLMNTCKQQLTKKQHYYPRFLLKYFANSNNQINVYVRQANKFEQFSYEKVCRKRNTYETDKVDNILETKLSTYEAKMSNILNEILSSHQDISISTETQDFIFKFMILQSCRTDSGRLSFINHYLHSILPISTQYKPRTCPYELHDVENNQMKIKLFNQIFKKPGELEFFFDSIKRPNFMKFHIALTSKNL